MDALSWFNPVSDAHNAWQLCWQKETATYTEAPSGLYGATKLPQSKEQPISLSSFERIAAFFGGLATFGIGALACFRLAVYTQVAHHKKAAEKASQQQMLGQKEGAIHRAWSCFILPTACENVPRGWLCFNGVLALLTSGFVSH